MTDWKDAIIVMKTNGKKNRVKRSSGTQIGLRCWDCGLYIDNMRTGHYCSRCLLRHLRKYMGYSDPGQLSKDSEPEDEDYADEEDSA